jgi:hypothetical protein
MVHRIASGLLALLLLSTVSRGESHPSYLGFDRNDYPGDAALPVLRMTFRYSSYWLNNPPGEQHNSWVGKRLLLKQQGFGFLVLFNGRLDAQLKGKDAAALGAMDGRAAVAAAAKEGFRPNVLIFLDQEEGGRLLSEQAAYLFAWVDTVRRAGARAGVYCSGIEVPDGSGTISTAQDVLEREFTRSRETPQNANLQSSGRQKLALWVANDQCPPSPGCTTKDLPASIPLSSAVSDSAVVWQYAQSPRRAQWTASCPKNYDPDGNCYAIELLRSASTFLDLDTAKSPDPSEAP